jgi:hypothetical protein
MVELQVVALVALVFGLFSIRAIRRAYPVASR